MLCELVVQADRASVAQELGGDPARAMAAPRHALQRKLLDGLRFLLKEQLKLNQPEGARAYGERHRLPGQSRRVPALCAGTSPGGCAGQARQATGLAVGAKALLETAATPQAPKWPEHLDL